MENLESYYDYFVTDYTSFYMVADDSNLVMCSNESGKIGKKLETTWYENSKKQDRDFFVIETNGKSRTVMKRKLPYLGCGIYGVVNNDLALKNLYDMPMLVLICAGIGIVILVGCLFFARQTIRPLSEMVEKMSMIREGVFDQYVQVEGTVEVKELADTYNYMLDDLQSYIDKLMETQKEQRKSEMKALEMQINPHYIYNTLSSIKWLVYQNDKEQTVKTIEAFIELLRNTISNKDEFITITRELSNIQNYILINHTRYGEAVQVEYYISENCYDLLLPKMILQPFIENAFFHAFPDGRSGTIQIYMRQKEENLQIRIVDDGVGMAQEQADRDVNQETGKEHYSGIGMHNVQERLKLLYGEEYGVRVVSREGQGTTVVITLPAKRKEEN